MKSTNLLNDIFNADQIEIEIINKRYLKIFVVILFLIITTFSFIKKDYYYENNLLVNDNSIFLLVDKNILNEIKDKKTILIDGIKTGYSINKIINEENICYLDIKLDIDIANISTKYKILLGKETIFEYIIRVISKVS